jgi:hypothetical protein
MVTVHAAGTQPAVAGRLFLRLILVRNVSGRPELLAQDGRAYGYDLLAFCRWLVSEEQPPVTHA